MLLIFDKSCRTPKPHLLHLSFSHVLFDFPEVITGHAARGIFQADFANSEGLTALQVAVKQGSCKVISVLVTDKLTKIIDEVIKAAAGNYRSGEEVMRLLLD